MKTILWIFLIVVSVELFPQSSTYIVKEEYGWVNPVGTLRNRFCYTNNLTVAIGKETSKNTTWLGRLEYFKLGDTRSEKLQFTRMIQPYKTEYYLTFPVKDLQMTLEVAGLSAEMQYKLYSVSFAELKLLGGFGIYRWKFFRGAYADSVTADIPIGDTSATTKKEIVDVFKLTANSQMEWSGGFYVGLDAAFQLYHPVWFTVSAHYKNVLGELWPALKLGMENVSGLQMAEYRVGLMIKMTGVSR